MSGKQRGIQAGVADDLAALNDVWGAIPSFTPRVGWWLAPQGNLGTGNAVAVRGRWSAQPLVVGRPGFTSDAASINVGTAAVAGTGAHVLVGLYPDDGTGFPDTTGVAPLATADFTVLTATGQKTVTWAGGPVVLAPGLYWIVTLYDYTTAPTTTPQFASMNNNAFQLPNPSGAQTPTVRAYTNSTTTRTALPTAVSFATGLAVSGGNDTPYVQIRRSA